jgi:hypothetical protein
MTSLKIKIAMKVLPSTQVLATLSLLVLSLHSFAQQAPDVPDAPTITEVTTNAVTLSWTAPADNGSAITGYRLQYTFGTAFDNGTWFDANALQPTLPPTSTSYTVAANNGQRYFFRLNASNDIGTSDYSSIVDTVTYANPTDILLTSRTIGENAEDGTLIGALSVNDSDVGESYTYTILQDNNNLGALKMAIRNNNELIKQAFDETSNFNHELYPTEFVTIKVDDTNGGTFTKTLTISIIDENDPVEGIFLISPVVYNPLNKDGFVSLIKIADEDENATHTLALVAGTGDTDNAKFEVRQDSLFIVSDDISQENFTIRISAEDAFQSAFEKSFTLPFQNLQSSGLDRTMVTGTEGKGFDLSNPFEDTEGNTWIIFNYKAPFNYPDTVIRKGSKIDGTQNDLVRLDVAGQIDSIVFNIPNFYRNPFFDMNGEIDGYAENQQLGPDSSLYSISGRGFSNGLETITRTKGDSIFWEVSFGSYATRDFTVDSAGNVYVLSASNRFTSWTATDLNRTIPSNTPFLLRINADGTLGWVVEHANIFENTNSWQNAASITNKDGFIYMYYDYSQAVLVNGQEVTPINTSFKYDTLGNFISLVEGNPEIYDIDAFENGILATGFNRVDILDFDLSITNTFSLDDIGGFQLDLTENGSFYLTEQLYLSGFQNDDRSGILRRVIKISPENGIVWSRQFGDLAEEYRYFGGPVSTTFSPSGFIVAFSSESITPTNRDLCTASPGFGYTQYLTFDDQLNILDTISFSYDSIPLNNEQGYMLNFGNTVDVRSNSGELRGIINSTGAIVDQTASGIPYVFINGRFTLNQRIFELYGLNESFFSGFKFDIDLEGMRTMNIVGETPYFVGFSGDLSNGGFSFDLRKLEISDSTLTNYRLVGNGREETVNLISGEIYETYELGDSLLNILVRLDIDYPRFNGQLLSLGDLLLSIRLNELNNNSRRIAFATNVESMSNSLITTRIDGSYYVLHQETENGFNKGDLVAYDRFGERLWIQRSSVSQGDICPVGLGIYGNKLVTFGNADEGTDALVGGKAITNDFESGIDAYMTIYDLESLNSYPTGLELSTLEVPENLPIGSAFAVLST